MRYRAELPGVVLALVLTGVALLAFVLALGIRGEGPFTLGLGDADGAARLPGGEITALGPSGGSLHTSTRAPAGSGAAARGTGASGTGADAAPRRTAALRGATEGASRGGVRTQARRTPAVTPAPTASAPTTITTTTQPVATSTPNPVAIKVRGRGKAREAPRVNVPKQRVNSRPGTVANPAPSPGSTSGPEPRADAPVTTRVVSPAATAEPGLGADDGVLTRVPQPTP
jgi:hypothetical protein